MKQTIVELARRSVEISRRGLCGGSADFSHPDCARFLSPLTVLAMEGDETALRFFCDHLLTMAQNDWGVAHFGGSDALSDAFCGRAIAECYKLLQRSWPPFAGALTDDGQKEVESWFFRLAMIRADGSVKRMSKFESWQNRNQCVPASMVYEIADLIDHSPLASTCNTAPLWKWADDNAVGWDLNWRSPDDAWLYQFIWTWSAYRQAALRRPELILSVNARRSFDFYKNLWAPGGHDLVFGESNPGDLLAAITSLALGAHLYADGEQKWLAERFLQQVELRGDDINLADRGPEIHRIYSLWLDDLEAVAPTRRSMLLESPLAGRGWSLGGTPYNEEIKAQDSRFPSCGVNLYDYDPIYQEKDANLYAVPKPDKLIFCEDAGDDALFALADLRAQGLHDHPDVPGVATLIADGLPWLVESAYSPRGFNRQRWLHNVPLCQSGRVSPEDMCTYRSDTWREVAAGDARLSHQKDHVLAQVRIGHDAFDYLDGDGKLFDLERTFLFDPRGLFVVVDRLTAVERGVATVAQAWHTPAQVQLQQNTARLSRENKTWHAVFAQNNPFTCDLTHREPPARDAFYFPGPITDILWHACLDLRPGDVVVMAAAFAREPATLSLDAKGGTMQCNEMKIRLDALGEVPGAPGESSGPSAIY